MNRRLQSLPRSSPNRTEHFHKYLKPGALALIRDSRISARSNRFNSLYQNYLQRAPSSPSSLLPSDGGQPQVNMIDGFPCFSGRVYGPRCPQRKRLTAARSVLFPIQSPASPVPDSLPNPIIGVFGSSDIVAAH